MDFKMKKEGRKFGITGFRNIGFTNDDLKEEHLTLNYSLNPSYIGDLVILIGPNNSGKSNVLDALTCWSANKISNRDVSDNFMQSNMRKPSLSMFSFIEDKRYKIKNLNKVTIEPVKEKQNVLAFQLDDYVPQYFDSNEQLQKYQRLIKLIDDTLKKHAINLTNNCDSGFTDDIYKSKLQLLMELEKYQYDYPHASQVFDDLKEDSTLKTFLDSYEIYLAQYKQAIRDEETKVSESNESDDGGDLRNYSANIIRYVEHHITNEDLECDADQISNSKFFSALLKMMGSNIEELTHTYEQAKISRGILISQSQKLSRRLDKITKYFNDLYCLDNNTYKFLIDLDATGINFSLFKEDNNDELDNLVALVLDHQSTGFRWFFDLFFNVFATNDLHPGDIIIMDEPATNLHVKGQEELRKFLKDFALKNGITFIIATHSPFLVSLDDLDEVRLINVHDKNIAYIDNIFTTINPDDTDALLPIRESLTVRSSVIIDPNQTVVFVEGITDYNYLVGMKSLDEAYKNITFLPIKGVGKDEKDMKERLKKLKKIKQFRSILLTDGDEAGQAFSQINEANGNKIKILKLSDVNPNFSEIESLFSDEDKTKFSIADKDTGLSVMFKKVMRKDPTAITDTTKNNFKELLNAIIKQFPVEKDDDDEDDSSKQPSKASKLN